MCKVDGCLGPHKALGLCQKHYSRTRRGKEAGDRTWFEMTWPERFESKILKNGTLPDYDDPYIRVTESDGACWSWPTRNKSGYGSFYLHGKARKAHRVSFELYVRDLEPGEVVDHLCRNEGCVNPSHLEAVTHRENIMRGNVRMKGDRIG